MKLALLGFPISHSLSPSLYREFLGDKLSAYELLEIKNPSEIPSLHDLESRFDGLSITSPHKQHFFHDVVIVSPIVRKLEAINTIAFRKDGAYGTNTDVIAVETILKSFHDSQPNLSAILLGDGVMANLTIIVASSLGIPLRQFSRNKGDDIAHLNLHGLSGKETIVINSCSRDFIFSGALHPDSTFWDYNYSFKPHQNTLPSQVKSYIDGEEMLRLQAKAAIEFWADTTA